MNSLSKSIGQLMKEGKKEDAETAKARVAEIKETSKGGECDRGVLISSTGLLHGPTFPDVTETCALPI